LKAKVGLARLLRLGLVLMIPPLWSEIVVLHFRGSFQSRFMWLPVLGLPVVGAGATASVLVRDERRARAVFRPFAWLMTMVGTAGAIFHIRGIGRQMGGFTNWKYNVVTGPPFPAPMQVALFGALGVLASASPSKRETHHLIHWIRLVDAFSYLLLGIEAGYNHWIGGYFNPLMFVPLIVTPLMAVIHLAALFKSRAGRFLEPLLSLVAVVAGLIGFGFHVRNILRRGGFSWQNLFYGPPVVAPLQMTAQGILGLLAAFFGGRR
jgi:hypothetical protein